ncbi:uncharacterized protein LOC110939954 [Helianthus annuus]|uniref:uncharacterized protein LOC110939954 n=1 Tax=Helianthus annuus TaxID=4232 RepID=UPI000B8F753C|nr:uncharacterized protein LOC110939954 [Helianthus annuus]
MVEVKIEYDWEPLRCSSCCVFGHEDNSCPKRPQVVSSGESSKKIDDFQVVGAKKKKSTNQGLPMKNQKPKVVYRPVVNPKPISSLKKPVNNQVSPSNPFDALKGDDGGQGGSTVGRIEKKEKKSSDRQDSDEEEVEEVYNETRLCYFLFVCFALHVLAVCFQSLCMEKNQDNSLEDLGFQSFSDRLHGDVFIRQSPTTQELRNKPISLGKGFEGRPTNIDDNPLIARRGVVQNDQKDPRPIIVINELLKITTPVSAAVDSKAENSSGGAERLGKQERVSQSYAAKLAPTQSSHKVNFRYMENIEAVDDVDVMIPIESVQQVQDRFANVLFGYFLGKRLVFPVVDYFVRNRWEKYGIQKCMMNGKGFFFFKFSSKEGMDKVLQDGPWLIRNIPLFLKYWSPNTELKKEELKKIPVWVKMHDVPLAAYTEDGLSLIASKIGVPKVLDNETSKMCTESWGRSGFARAIIELDAEKEAKDNIMIAIPNVEDGGILKSNIRVEYEWKPPRCNTCKVFGHISEECPKISVEKVDTENKGKNKVDEQGFKYGNNRKKASKQQYHVKEKPKDEEESDVEEVRLAMDDGMPNLMKGDSFNKTGASTPAEKVIAVLESHVKVANLDKVCKNVFRNWDWASNGAMCAKGTRIILGWHMDNIDVMVVDANSQVMHTQIMFKNDKKMIYASFVYASNCYKERRQLWESLKMHKGLVNNNPWIILGDFNVALNIEDKYMGSSKVNAVMTEFKDCVEYMEAFDINASGIHYTWNQRSKTGVGIRKKLDRIMSNVHFTDAFPEGHAVYLPYGVSDHCPCVLKLPSSQKAKPKPFKFTNMLVHKKEFVEIVQRGWNLNVDGVPMFRVVKKLKGLKHAFRSLLHKQGNIHKKVDDLKKELDILQSNLDRDPNNSHIRDSESACLKRYHEATLDEERFLKQKAKQKWLEVGDANTAYFHNVVKCRNHVNKIHSIKDAEGNHHDGEGVADALVDQFKVFLGNKGNVSKKLDPNIISTKLSNQVANHMSRRVTIEEVKGAIFSINENKSPGPDGYTSELFKKSWEIISSDVTMAVLDFFESGRLLQEINHTFLALIPKVATPSIVTDYRPISCCNVIYKGISKIITNRILEGLNEIISENQSAFVPGRRISDNILLTQELMHNYHRQVGPPRCAFKVDIQKAYDMGFSS